MQSNSMEDSLYCHMDLIPHSAFIILHFLLIQVMSRQQLSIIRRRRQTMKILHITATTQTTKSSCSVIKSCLIRRMDLALVHQIIVREKEIIPIIRWLEELVPPLV